MKRKTSPPSQAQLIASIQPATLTRREKQAMRRLSYAAAARSAWLRPTRAAPRAARPQSSSTPLVRNQQPIEWTPRLRQVVERAKNLGRRNITWVITSQEAQRYDYEAFKSSWARAVARSGVKDIHFHDLRAKALTDKEASSGMQAARRMGAHSTEGQTAGYVRHRKAQRTDATR